MQDVVRIAQWLEKTPHEAMPVVLLCRAPICGAWVHGELVSHAVYVACGGLEPASANVLFLAGVGISADKGPGPHQRPVYLPALAVRIDDVSAFSWVMEDRKAAAPCVGEPPGVNAGRSPS